MRRNTKHSEIGKQDDLNEISENIIEEINKREWCKF